MITLFFILLIVIGSCMTSAGKDWEASERNKEIRHQELMKRKTITRKRVIRDEHGRFISESVTIEGVED